PTLRPAVPPRKRPRRAAAVTAGAGDGSGSTWASARTSAGSLRPASWPPILRQPVSSRLIPTGGSALREHRDPAPDADAHRRAAGNRVTSLGHSKARIEVDGTRLGT